MCLLLALCAAIGYFQTEGWLIQLLPKLLKGLMGYGYHLAAPSLAVAGAILLRHRGRPVTLRTTCALLLPPLWGCVGHMLFCKEEFTAASAGVVPALWKGGLALTSGGVVSGGLAQGFRAVFGNIAATIVFVVVFILLGAVVFQRAIAWAWGRWQARERIEYEAEEDDYEEEPRPRRPVQNTPRPTPTPAPRPAAPARSAIDIPLDDEEAAQEKRPGILSGFFRQKSKDQRTPDQVLREGIQPPRREEETMDSPFVEDATQTPRPVPRPTAAERPHLLERREPTGLSSPAVSYGARTASAEPPAAPLSKPLTAAAPAEAVQEAEPVSRPAERKVIDFPGVRPAERREAAPVQPASPVREETPRGLESPAPSRRWEKREMEDAAAEVSAALDSALVSAEGEYRYPPITLLNQSAGGNPAEAGAELRSNAQRLADTLVSFGVDAAPGDVVRGPSVTRYEFILEQGVKLSKITNLADDIALALGASGVRIAPVPDKIAVVGIEVPNRHVSPVLIRDVIESRTFTAHKSAVAFAVGRDIANEDMVGDIARLPHVLIAGTTGSGKSVCTNSLIISLLYKSTPEEVRFIMVDPKMVELAPYNGIPHLLIPVVTDPKKAAGALQWAVFEMMKRYKTFSELGVKKLEEYNAIAAQREDMQKMATVVVVIDELADLMLVAAKEVEESICRVAQMGRAAGIHLVIATQRPSADVITGLMKANIPSRIAFAVASGLESRIILDNPGAEKLVGRGDMLYAPLGEGKPRRVQGCFITPEEIDRVVAFVKQSGEAEYSDEVMQKIEEAMAEKEKGSKKDRYDGSTTAAVEELESDGLFPAAVDVVLETGMASVSMLQRRLKLGYSRAARLVDQMEEQGIVGPFEGSKPRQVLITKAQWQELQMKRSGGTGGEADPSAGGEDDAPWDEE